jgi:predicted Zn-dependent protease
MKLNISVALLVAYLTSGISLAQSIDLDKKLGAENAAMVEAQYGIYQDKEKTEYIRRVGERLVSKLEKPLFDYQFHIVPDKSPNAFALPGGYIYITTGLIPLLETEDELACIMGHEIIHSNNRHTIRQLKKSILPRLLEVPGNLLGALNEELGVLFNAPIQTSNALLFASYSRNFETESDINGTALAAAAGYDPNAMISSLNRLSEAIEVAIGQKETKNYFNDHPYTPDRVNSIQKNVEKLTWQHSEYISPDFLYEFDSLLFGDHPNKGVVVDNSFLHPDLDFTITFPEKWDIDNQPTNVGAYNQDRQAAVFVSLDNSNNTPIEAGKLFLSDLDSEYKEKLTATEEYMLNGRKGYLVSFTDKTEATTMYAYILWIPLEDKLFKLIGLAPLEYKTKLEESAKSLRVLKKNEKNSFTINLVRVVQAREGETIKTLSARTGNSLNDELTGVINSRNPDDKLGEGGQIKVVIQYSY